MIRAAVIFFSVALVSHAAVLDVPRFLGAVRAVEEWNGRDGRHGERGPWQITAAVWSMHMPGIPFAEARKIGPARACALKHVAWLREQLIAAGTDDNAFNVALCWNAGAGATLRGRAPMSSYGYAVRVVELYGNGAKGQKTLNSPAEINRRWSDEKGVTSVARELTKDRIFTPVILADPKAPGPVAFNFSPEFRISRRVKHSAP